jgi:adenylosuccinate synthase
VAGGACTGLGIGPTRIDSVLGVTKAYLTRVGAGPFPAEAEPEQAAVIREQGAEYGTVTGRDRRCGWLDLVGLRYAVRLNGLTSLAVTKLDVLSLFAEIPVCTGYRLQDGTVTAEFPTHQSDFHHARPVYQVLPGWQTDISGAAELADLPVNARRYLEFVEERLGVPVALVGVGQRRDQTITVREVLQAA